MRILANRLMMDALTLTARPFSSCALFGLSRVDDLAHVLRCRGDELLRLGQSRSNYIRFETTTAGKTRDIAAPRWRLDEVQREINDHLRRLGEPEYLHSGTRGRSYVSHAKVHSSGEWLCKIDLRAFYRQVRATHVQRFFLEEMQCAPRVASLLTRLCTIEGHVPIGGRISERLAFLIVQPMFDALYRLGKLHQLCFSVYLDDMCFSGPSATRSFLWEVKKVIYLHGFRYHAAKCYPPGTSRLVSGISISDGRVTISPQQAKRIRQELASLDRIDRSEADIKVLLGRLAAAASVDKAYLPALRLVKARLHASRGREVNHT